MFKLNYILITFSFLFLYQQIIGQDYIYNSNDVSVADGLLTNRISTIHQDEDGFIWLRTLDGVGRYDGHSFKWFTKSNTDLRGIPNEKILVEDADGYFWFTDGLRVDLMHRKTFEVIPFEEKFKGNLPFEGPADKFYQGLNGEVVIKRSHKKSFFYYHPSTGFRSLPFLKGATAVTITKSGIWGFYNSSGAIKYNLENGKVLKKLNIRGKIKFIKNKDEGKDLFSLYEPEKNELSIINVLKDGIEEVIRLKAKGKIQLNNKYILYNSVKDLFILNIPYKNHSCSIIDIENKKIIPVSNIKKGKESTFERTIFIDKKGICWQQTKSGLRLLNITKPIFNHYAPFKPIRGIWANEKNLIIKNDVVDLNNPKFSTEYKPFKNIGCTAVSLKDELWLGTRKSLIEIDQQSFKVINKIEIEKEKEKAPWSILRDKEGRWWIGLINKGISAYSPKAKKIQPFKQYNDYPALKKSSVLHLLEDGQYIWAVSSSGLFLIHKKGGVIHRYYSGAEANYQLPLDDVHHLHKDKNGVFWVATNADGLVRFELDDELKVKNIKRYTTEDNLSSNVLYAIIEDTKERLWISTLSGISCFKKESEEIQVYSEKDGLPELEFNRIAYFQATDGKIYFGSLGGVIGFYPNEVVKTRKYNSPIYASDFSLYEGKQNKIVNKTQELQKDKKIRLQPNDRFFRLSVSMVDYFNSNKLSYSYKIDGLFDSFQKIEGNSIEISGLPYGKYKLVVRGQSTDKRYSQQRLEIPLIVVRPFYFRWWFILLIITLLVLSILQVYYWRIRHLEERRVQLELLVNERTKQIQLDKKIIEEQTEQLKELDQLKSRFFANISHELRTPLTLILAPLDGVIRRKNQNNKDFTALQLMQQNGKKLLKRINELLDLSRLDAKKLEVNETPTFLYPFLKTILSTFESATNINNIHLLFDYDLDEQIQVLLDTDKLEKIISNYLSNALKFTPKKGQIKLNAQKEGNQLHLSVSDTGIGILPEELDKVFDRFYQTSQTQKNIGSGIGLSLCKELAKVLNGKVWATSQIGSGSVFYVQIPLVETFATKENIQTFEPSIEEPFVILESNSPAPISDNNNRPKLLIVEDNADLRQYISLVLSTDYIVVSAENGEEAMEKLKADGLPSLIISDIMMPVMDGIELLKMIKTSDNLRHIPMIMLTARQNMEVKLEALRIGVDDYLTKPFKEEELLVRIENLINNSKSRVVIAEEEESKEEKSISAADMEWLIEVETIIIKEISNPKFKLLNAAEMMNISYRRLQQKIKGITGLSPKQYQRSIKLAKAREILKSGEVQTVTEVMYKMGFDNHHYFSKMYKEAYGIMPSEEL